MILCLISVEENLVAKGILRFLKEGKRLVVNVD